MPKAHERASRHVQILEEGMISVERMVAARLEFVESFYEVLDKRRKLKTFRVVLNS